MPKVCDDCGVGEVSNRTLKFPVRVGSNSEKSPTPLVIVPEKTGVPSDAVTMEKGVPSAASGEVKRLLPLVL